MSHDKAGHGGGKKPYTFQLIYFNEDGGPIYSVDNTVAWNYEEAMEYFSKSVRGGRVIHGKYALVNMNTCTVRDVSFTKPEPVKNTWKVNR